LWDARQLPRVPDGIKGSPDASEAGSGDLPLVVRANSNRSEPLPTNGLQQSRCIRDVALLHSFQLLPEAQRQTPVMAAGLTDHVWTVAELLETGPETRRRCIVAQATRLRSAIERAAR